MRIWAIANQKGGVGKTTSAVTLAGHLVKMGLSVLLIDMDPHGSLSAYFGINPDEETLGVYPLFQPEKNNRPAVKDLVRPTGIEGLTLLPASSAMITLDRQLGTFAGMGMILSSSLQDTRLHYDYVLIDCPPMLGVLMVNALAACEQLIIPVQTEFLAMKGLERITNTLRMINQSQQRELNFTIVPTFFDRRTRASIKSLRCLKDNYGDKVWNGVIPIDTQFREASTRRLPLPLFIPRSRGAEAYASLLESLLRPQGSQQQQQQQQYSTVMEAL